MKHNPGVSQVRTVYCGNDITKGRVGFITRESVLDGHHDLQTYNWVATQEILAPRWSKRFPTRKEARLYLEKCDKLMHEVINENTDNTTNTTTQYGNC